jgi:SAM-dependent methyltransferase
MDRSRLKYIKMKRAIKKIVPDIFIKVHKDYKKQLRIKPYLGDNVFCPVCKSEFKKFAPFGPEKRENARCPSCGSLERHRLIWKYLNDKTNLFDNAAKIKLLHFAPEHTFYDIFSKDQNIEYVPCDLFPEFYNYDGEIKIIKVDMTKIPFEENYFDAILCNDVLEHIPDDRLAMAELYRVMKKGAWGIFQVPIDYKREVTYEDFSITTAEGKEKAFGQSDHVRWYGRDYQDRLRSAGFDVVEDNYVKKFSSEEVLRFGILYSQLIYYCVK